MKSSEPDITACDLCGRLIAAWEWDERYTGKAEAQAFTSAQDDDHWVMVRCSHCAVRTAITEGGEA